MNREIFADGISAVHVTGNLVRIDLMTVQPQLKSKDGQPVVEVHQRDLSVMQTQGAAGVFDFEAWKRRIDKIDDSWRQ